MDSQKLPYNHILFVCTFKREDGSRISCGMQGSEKLCDALKDEVAKRGLKGKVRVSKSGCLDVCEQGPNLMSFPDAKLWTHVAEADLPKIHETYLTAKPN
jgi:(2Fe-2S) ferredoxin